LQRGRVDVGFLGAAQIDRYGNLNSTVIGNYSRPTVRLPGGGGAPEIATHAREVLIVMKHSRAAWCRSWTSAPRVAIWTDREHAARSAAWRGPQMVITDLGVFAASSRDR